MAFDMDSNSVESLRRKYEGSTPSHEMLAKTAYHVQQDLIDGTSAIIGGVTTIGGVQSTKTRRPISASIDIVVKEADISELGESYDSWSHFGSYFADVNDIEVGVLDIQEFKPYDFPSEILENSYEAEIKGYQINFGEPTSNIASKFNRINPTNQRKNSDLVDFNSHLHWMAEEKLDLASLATKIDDSVEPPYDDRLKALNRGKDNFTSEEQEILDSATERLEELLEE